MTDAPREPSLTKLREAWEAAHGEAELYHDPWATPHCDHDNPEVCDESRAALAFIAALDADRSRLEAELGAKDAAIVRWRSYAESADRQSIADRERSDDLRSKLSAATSVLDAVRERCAEEAQQPERGPLTSHYVHLADAAIQTATNSERAAIAALLPAVEEG